VNAIEGKRVRLRPSRLEDRRAIYEWLALSDVTSRMLGPPTFPDAPVPDWAAFCADYSDEHFEGSKTEDARSFIIEVGGAAVGQINYDRVGMPEGCAELDIWMRSSQHCGRGWGSDALITMCQWLHERFRLTSFLIRPSERNERAIRAYARAGFERVEMSAEEQTRRFGPGDYSDSVVLIRRIGSDPAGGSVAFEIRRP
jgi:RimJ/RimL family protein N-acetyltransferase